MLHKDSTTNVGGIQVSSDNHYRKFAEWIEGKDQLLPHDKLSDSEELLARLVRLCQKRAGHRKLTHVSFISFEEAEELIQAAFADRISAGGASKLLSALKSSQQNFEKIRTKLCFIDSRYESEAEELIRTFSLSNERVIHHLKKTLNDKPAPAPWVRLSSLLKDFLNLFASKPAPAFGLTAAILLFSILGALTLTGGINDPVYDYYFRLDEPYVSFSDAFRGKAAGAASTVTMPFKANLNVALGEYLTGDYDKAIKLLKNLQDSMMTTGRVSPEKQPQLFADVYFYTGLAHLAKAESQSRWTYKKHLYAAQAEFLYAKKYCTGNMATTIDEISFFDGMTHYLLKDVEPARAVLKPLINSPEFGQRAISMLERMENF